MKRLGFFVGVLVCFLLRGELLPAQVTTGTIMGTVTDSTGAVIPGASVTLRNTETGISRTETSDASGRYRAPQLTLGNYEVTITAAGFQTEVRSGITLTVGREAAVDAALKVGGVEEKITVTGEAPLIETTNSTVSSLVNEQQMRDLPLNGRNFSDLTAIQPGVVTNTGIGASTFTGGSRMSINGARPQQSTYLLDGIDIVAPYENVTPASVLNQSLGVDTIREFTLLQNNFGAQYGRAAGGVVNAVTRSGTNELHGGAFEFLRNNVLDARNFFDRKTVVNTNRLPPFERNQFGATIGGPIRKDKTFFFLSYEGVQQKLGITQSGIVPTQETRNGNITGCPTGLTTCTPAQAVTTSTVTINSLSQFFLGKMVLPNGAYLPGGVGQYFGSINQAGHENYGMVRIDQKLSEKDTLFGRFTIDDSDNSQPQILTIPQSQNVNFGGYRFAALEWTRLMSPTVLNTVRVGFTRDNNANNPQTADLKAMGYGLQTRLAPDLGYNIVGPTINGLSIPGGVSDVGVTEAFFFIDNTYQYNDTINWTAGRHSLVLGTDIRRYQQNENPHIWDNGAVTFPNLLAFLQGKPNIDTITLPLQTTTAPFIPDEYRGWRQWYGSAFFQDDFQLRPNLTINLGLRWERVTSPTEINGKIAILKTYLDPNYTQLAKGTSLFSLSDHLKGFSPRVGLAWTPLSKTVVRAGFGLFKEIPLEYIYQLTVYVPPWANRLVIANSPWPFPLTGSNATAGEPTVMNPNTLYPYVSQWNLGIEQQLTNTAVVKVSYLGTRGVHQMGIFNPNQPFTQVVNGRQFTPLNSPVPNPSFNSIRATDNIGDTYYDAVQLVFEKRFSRGLQTNVSFTWSKNIDDTGTGLKGAEGVGTIFISYNSRDVAADKALSTLHTPRNFLWTVNYELPFGHGRALGGNVGPMMNTMIGGWQINTIASYRAGLPMTAYMTFDNSRSKASVITDRPDLAPGCSNNLATGDPNHWFNTSCILVPTAGFFGNLARDTIVQDSLVSVNFSLFKDFSLGERRSLQFRAEFFNLTNHTNFGLPSGVTFTNAAGATSATSGQVTSINGTPRQIQFALKFTF